MKKDRQMSEPDFYKMTGPEMVEYCGDNAARWAEAFCRIKEKQGWGAMDIDEGLMIGWFANAIEHSTQVRSRPVIVSLTEALTDGHCAQCGCKRPEFGWYGVEYDDQFEKVIRCWCEADCLVEWNNQEAQSSSIEP
jgi:hypothetical protein